MIGDCKKPLTLLRFSVNHPCAECDTYVTFVYIGGVADRAAHQWGLST